MLSAPVLVLSGAVLVIESFAGFELLRTLEHEHEHEYEYEHEYGHEHEYGYGYGYE